MLQLRPSCDCCDKYFLNYSSDSLIFTFECTFCRDCVENRLHGICPNCGGNFAPRPIRPPVELARNPASTQRVFNPQGCAPSLTGRKPHYR